MDLIESACIALAVVKNRRRDLKKRKVWANPINIERIAMGRFQTLFQELRSDSDKFIEYFQMSIPTFDELLSKIKTHIKHQNTQMRLAIPPEERLAVAIRYLVTGYSYHLMHLEFHIGKSTIRGIVQNTSVMLWKILKDECMPEPTEERWLEISSQIYERTNFPNCIGVIQCRDVPLLGPNGPIVLLVVVDADYCFTTVEIELFENSSCMDILHASAIGKNITSHDLSIPGPTHLPKDSGQLMPHVLVGDESFGCSDYLLRPFSSKSINKKKRIFNYRLSRTLRMADTAFGMLAKRWAILNSSMTVCPELAGDLVKACCILHNFIEKRDITKFDDLTHESKLESIMVRSSKYDDSMIVERNYLADYFLTQQGAIPIQNIMINQ